MRVCAPPISTLGTTSSCRKESHEMQRRCRLRETCSQGQQLYEHVHRQQRSQHARTAVLAIYLTQITRVTSTASSTDPPQRCAPRGVRREAGSQQHTGNASPAPTGVPGERCGSTISASPLLERVPGRGWIARAVGRQIIVMERHNWGCKHEPVSNVPLSVPSPRS